MDRLTELKQKYPKFYYNGYEKQNIENFYPKSIMFPIVVDKVFEQIDAKDLVEKLNKLIDDRPQCTNIFINIYDDTLSFEGCRDETIEEFEARKLEAIEKNELYDLLIYERDVNEEAAQYNKYLELHEKYKNNKHSGGAGDTERPNPGKSSNNRDELGDTKLSGNRFHLENWLKWPAKL